jgi:hypothetical protein
MTQPQTPRRNWFFTLLIPASIAFAVTAVALAVVPVIEERAAQAGSPPPESTLRAALRRDGWVWLLIETGIVIVLSLAAMTWDWLTREEPGIGNREPGIGNREINAGGQTP